MNLNREPISTDQIHQFQDFNRLKKDYLNAKKTVWKSPWFWGAGGIASLALVVATAYTRSEQTKVETNGVKITQQTEVKKQNRIDGFNPAPEVAATNANDALSSVSTKSEVLKEIQRLEAKLERSDLLPDSKGFHFRLDALSDEFPEVACLVGKRLEVVGSQFLAASVFDVEWERIAVKTKEDNRYTLYFQRKNESKSLNVKVVADGVELEKEEQRLLIKNQPVEKRIVELRASL